MKLKAYEFTRKFVVFALDEEQAKYQFGLECEDGIPFEDPDDWTNKEATDNYGDRYACNICSEEMTEAEEIAYGGRCANCKGQKERGEA